MEVRAFLYSAATADDTVTFTAVDESLPSGNHAYQLMAIVANPTLCPLSFNPSNDPLVSLGCYPRLEEGCCHTLRHVVIIKRGRSTIWILIVKCKCHPCNQDKCILNHTILHTNQFMNHRPINDQIGSSYMSNV
jgi:hypothetical protein